jgi:membrane protease YdiL (CAAX protease family)
MTMKTRGVLAYLLLAFGLAWSMIFVARLLLGLSLENSLVQIPIAFSPAIAAVIVRRWITKEGFGDAGLALHLRSGWAYYLVAWLFPLIAVGVVIGLATMLGISRPDLSQLGTFFPGVQLPGWASLLLLMGVPILMMPLFWGEEFGWRGYLQIRLLSHSPLKAAIATGFIWAVWHYPLYFLGYSEYANPFIGLVTSTVFAILLAIILAWLRLSTRSVWSSSLAHAGTNMVLATLSTALLVGGAKIDWAVNDLLQSVPLAVICAWIILSGQLRADMVPDQRSAPTNRASAPPSPAQRPATPR